MIAKGGDDGKHLPASRRPRRFNVSTFSVKPATC